MHNTDGQMIRYDKTCVSVLYVKIPPSEIIEMSTVGLSTFKINRMLEKNCKHLNPVTKHQHV